MAEPEEVLIDAAHRIAEATQRAWQRHARARAAPRLTLDTVRLRLQLLLAAVCGTALAVHAADPPAAPTWLARLMRRQPLWLADTEPIPSTDGASVFLPRELSWACAPEDALAVYRALALQQAGRALRHPQKAWREPADPLTRQLFLLSEAAAVDYALARTLPGLVPDLRAVRLQALAQRPPIERLTPRERYAETLLRRALAGEPAELPEALASTPQHSAAWAEAAGRDAARLPGPCRVLPRGLWLGALRPAGQDERTQTEPPAPGQLRSPRRSARLARRPEMREAEEGEDDAQASLCMMPLDDGHEHVEDPMGLQRPADRMADADPEALADSLSELPEARLVSTPEPAAEVLITEDAPDRCSVARPGNDDGAPGLAYPEWDWRIGDYRNPGAVVRIEPPKLGEAAWTDRVLARRRVLVAEVRRRFTALRPRRVIKPRQPDGDEIDLDAFVEAHADRLAGSALADRLYRTEHRARRDLVILLLIDVSGSTDSWVAGDLRTIDVEKEALLVVCQALDALGDPYAIHAFASEGPQRVKVQPIKGFDERDLALIGRRIAALEPDGYTRVGAALRHATRLLAQTRAQHRLLLLLSDGRPNDIDHYEGRYGVEDMRQAVAEAGATGIHPFCLTVDRQAPAYLPAVFGCHRYALLEHPERLSAALVDLLRHLIRR